jgi:hypothetical protein
VNGRIDCPTSPGPCFGHIEPIADLRDNSLVFGRFAGVVTAAEDRTGRLPMMPGVKFAAQQRLAKHLALQHAAGAEARRLGQPLAAVLLLGLLAGCASAFDALPHAAGGLPAATPARSAEQAAYPDVHNMPPDRRAPVMTEAEQKQAEKDLIAIRDKQQRTSAAMAKEDQDSADGTATSVTPDKPAAKPANKPTKKNVKPADPSAGTGRNP